MALNITIDGFNRLGDNSLSNSNVKYQGLFYPNGTASSSTTWNNVRTVENTGYYNANLGDLDWLGQDGTALNNSKVIVVFWKGTPLGDDRNALCDVLEEWGAFEITIDGSDTYTNATQVDVNIRPTLVWTLAATGFVNTPYSTTNGSYDVHSWAHGSTTMWHWRTRYGQNIQLINTVTGTLYDWDDGSAEEHFFGAATGTHQWSLPGIYDVEIVIEDECSATTTGTKQIQIYSPAPTCGIHSPQATGQNITTPDTVVSFEYDGTDSNNAITDIKWKINDTGSYGNTSTTISGVSVSGTVYHTNGLGTAWCGDTSSSGAFTNPGNHLIETWINWYDGFSNQVLYCAETFNQQQFSGPTVDFTQVPTNAVVASGVKFVNSSTNVSRVGLGLPDCEDYEWTWNDDGNITIYSDKPYSYELNETPTTANCSVKLCAGWSDGWATLSGCEEKDVVFKTTVTVTPEECYYNLDIIGTSGDGSVSGYSWDIYKYTSYSGAGPPTGATELLWESPQGMTQQDKDVCFTSEGWYKIEGFVHGTGATTSDYENLSVDEVCVASGIAAECTLVIWNGTGVDDVGGDWTHGAQGTEEAYAKHSGTNGLDASLTQNQHVQFTSGAVDIGQYDLLSAWVNVRSWDADAHVEVTFTGPAGFTGDTVNLDAYINKSLTTMWQRALIPYEDLGLTPQQITYVNKLDFKATGNIDVYLDDIEVAVGTVAYMATPICEPEVYAYEFGDKRLTGDELRPSKRAQEAGLPPGMRADLDDDRPSMESGTIKPPFPKPRNL